MRVRIVDAFTRQPFGGNPAGVVLLEGQDWPADAWLADVARELGLPMTAFARPRPQDDPQADWDLRWLHPRGEERMCGHATLALAHALAEDRGGPGRERFATLSGVLAAEAAADGTVTLDFPAATVTECVCPDGLAAALGAAPEATFSTGPLRDVIAVFAGEDAVRALAPDMDALAAIARRDDMRQLTATAPADAGTAFDIVSRCFAPADGLPEDHVTGSAHTALAPYWAQRLGRTTLRALQASGRPGELGLELRGDRVLISGHAVTVLDGTLTPGH